MKYATLAGHTKPGECYVYGGDPNTICPVWANGSMSIGDNNEEKDQPDVEPNEVAAVQHDKTDEVTAVQHDNIVNNRDYETKEPVMRFFGSGIRLLHSVFRVDFNEPRAIDLITMISDEPWSQYPTAFQVTLSLADRTVVTKNRTNEEDIQSQTVEFNLCTHGNGTYDHPLERTHTSARIMYFGASESITMRGDEPQSQWQTVC